MQQNTSHSSVILAVVIPALAAFTLGLLACVATLSPAPASAQATTAPNPRSLRPTPDFPLTQQGLLLTDHIQAGRPFTVAGPRGVVLGQQEGIFESWILPIKLLSHFTIEAEVEGYPVPIDLNAAASEIEVTPDHTTITYSHIAFTVRQIMFAPDAADPGTGAVVFFQIDSVRPINLTFRFTPEMRPMWPQQGTGTASPEWVQRGNSGFYILHTDFPSVAGAVAIPGAKPGILAPYQEKPQVHPVELKLHVDPKTDRQKYFPLLMAASQTAATSTTEVLESQLQHLDDNLPQIYAAHAAAYAKRAATLTSITTPDHRFNEDFSWAVTSIEQLKATTQQTDETGLVAGYFSSGDSARPGFGWYFGRDTLYTLYAVNGFGDFTLSRAALEFLMHRQRADGKVMHEYSQTAAATDWKSFPYMYAAADATPLFLTAMLDYVQSSGDVSFLRAHRREIASAWQFETTHDADSDGIYDNAQGTGWVESWPGGMPRQEIYLALFDQQASAAMATLATLLEDPATAKSAAARASAIQAKIEAEYFTPATSAYAFSQNPDKSTDNASTIFPAVAWWNANTPGLAHADASFRRWASHDFATDWGLRDVAESDPVYDPISYHQGSVWPLFTGWASVAEYRTNRTLSGYQHLMQTANLTRAQDLGAVTELLSGAFFQPFGRSTSHQLWSSAMVVIPALRGLFGISANALTHTLTLTPQLPADWNDARVDNLRIGTEVCTLTYHRQATTLQATLTGCPAIYLTTSTFPLPAVEVTVPHELPLPGARTAQLKVLTQTLAAHSLTLELEAQADSIITLPVIRNQPGLHLTAQGATLTPSGLEIHFPAGTGYQSITITLHW